MGLLARRRVGELKPLMPDDINQPTRVRLNFFQTMRAVAWGFFGVRRGKGYAEDTANLNPLHLIVAGVLAAIFFVVALIWIARGLIVYLT